MTLSSVIQETLAGLMIGSVFGLVALGINLIFATSRVLNFAQGDLLMIGAYFGFILASDRYGVPLLVAVVGGVMLAGGLAILLERVAVRPLRRVPGSLGWIMGTFAAGVVIRDAATNIFGGETHRYPSLVPDGGFQLAGAFVPYQYLAVLGAAALVMLAIDTLVERTRFGRALRAVAYRRDVASLMGVNPDLVVVQVFALAGVLAAVAGVLVAPIYQINTQLGLSLGLGGFTAAVLGGTGSARGAMLGGLLLGLVQRYAEGQVFNTRLINPTYRDLVTFVILVLVLMLLPQGLLRRREAVRA